MEQNVTIYGLLAEQERGQSLSALVEPWLELLDPAEPADGDVGYPYMSKGKDGSVAKDVVADPVELLDLTESCRSIRLGEARDQQWLTYRSVPVVLNLYGSDEDFFQSPVFDLWHPIDFLAHDANRGEEFVERTIELACEAADRLDAMYVYGFAAFENSPLSSPEQHPDQSTVTNGDVPDLHWLNVFPPAVVEQLGRETVLSTPAYRIEDLEDGSVLLVVQEFPDEKDVDRWVEVREHLGLLE